jgi:iron complex transport system ATP-binding protein
VKHHEDIFCLDGLVCGYENFSLHRISLQVKKGTFNGIIGPNGSGKTTLLKAISGLLKVQKGSILYKERELRDLKKKDLAKEMAVVSQSSSFPDITVRDYVSLGRIPFYRKLQFIESGHDLDIIKESMKITGVHRFRDQSIRRLSGGEQQLCIIARALAQEPDILLLDEPTNFLDISHQVEIMDLLKHLNQDKHITIIMVLHDLNLASEYCRNLFLLKEGRIYTSGSPEQVLTYQNIEEVYNTTVVVHKSPVSGKPFVYIVAKALLDQSKSTR